jgi:hypothetical protein
MTATGQASKAIDEAKALAAETEDPDILIEANYLMAQAANKDLREFLKENPRWEIDPNVIDGRHRLHNKVLELYLYPSLFFGSNSVKAARGLWGAFGVYQLCGEHQLAIETARDIVAFYPVTPEAALAKAHLDSLTPEQLAIDWEAQGKRKSKTASLKTRQHPLLRLRRRLKPHHPPHPNLQKNPKRPKRPNEKPKHHIPKSDRHPAPQRVDSLHRVAGHPLARCAGIRACHGRLKRQEPSRPVSRRRSDHAHHRPMFRCGDLGGRLLSRHVPQGEIDAQDPCRPA